MTARGFAATVRHNAPARPHCSPVRPDRARGFPNSKSFQDVHFKERHVMEANYEIRVWDDDRQLLYVTPAIRVTEEEARQKAVELLSRHGGASFTLERQLACR